MVNESVYLPILSDIILLGNVHPAALTVTLGLFLYLFLGLALSFLNVFLRFPATTLMEFIFQKIPKRDT